MVFVSRAFSSAFRLGCVARDVATPALLPPKAPKHSMIHATKAKVVLMSGEGETNDAAAAAAASNDDAPFHERADDIFPAEPIASIRSKISELGAEEISASCVISFICTGNRSDVVTNVRLLGTFPTADWKSDPTIPDFVGDFHEYCIGYYNVAECDLMDAGGTATRLILVVNEGDGDCNTGYWGAAFERSNGEKEEKEEYRVIARFESAGDTETAVEEVDGGVRGFAYYRERVQGDIDGGDDASNDDGLLIFPRFRDIEEEDEEEGKEYFSGLSPGMCRTQLEKLLGVAMGRIMQGREWRELPKCLRDYGSVW